MARAPVRVVRSPRRTAAHEARGYPPGANSGGRPFPTVFEAVLGDLGHYLRQMVYPDQDDPFEGANLWTEQGWVEREDEARRAVARDWTALTDRRAQRAAIGLAELDIDTEALQVLVDGEFLHAFPPYAAQPAPLPTSRSDARTRRCLWEVTACLKLKDHPDWTNRQIAAASNIHPSTLGRSTMFRRARQTAAGPLPHRGFMRRDADGRDDVEAVDDGTGLLSPPSRASAEVEATDARIDAAESARNATRNSSRSKRRL